MANAPPRVRNWVDLLFKVVPGHIPFVAGFLMVLVFVSGLCIARAMDFASAYCHSFPVYIACIVIGWVTGCVRWGLVNLPTFMLDLKVCLPDKDFDSFADRWLRRFGSQIGMALCGTLLFLVGASLVYVGMFDWFPPSLKDATNTVSHVFAGEWYTGNLLQRLLLIYYLGAWSALAGGAGTWLFIVNIPFLFKVGRMRALRMPTVLIAQFRSASDFYLMGTTAWFVAVALVVLLFFRNLTATASIFLLVCSAIGLSAFLFPQYIFHKFLVKAQSHIACLAVDEYNSNSSTSIPAEPVATELQRLAELAKLTQPAAMWVYDLSDVAVFVASNAIAPLALAVKSFTVTYLAGK